MAVPMNPFTGYSPSQLKQMASGLGYTGEKTCQDLGIF